MQRYAAAERLLISPSPNYLAMCVFPVRTSLQSCWKRSWASAPIDGIINARFVTRQWLVARRIISNPRAIGVLEAFAWIWQVQSVNWKSYSWWFSSRILLKMTLCRFSELRHDELPRLMDVDDGRILCDEFCCLSSGAQPHLVAFASCWNIPWPMETCHAYASPSEFFHAGSGLRTLLWKMTKGRAPADAAQMGPQVPWVQSWQVPGGCVMFNHLTAAVMLELGALAKRGGVEKSWNRGTPLLLVTLYVAWKDQGYHGRNLQHVLVWLQTMWQWVSQLLSDVTLRLHKILSTIFRNCNRHPPQPP